MLKLSKDGVRAIRKFRSKNKGLGSKTLYVLDHAVVVKSGYEEFAVDYDAEKDEIGTYDVDVFLKFGELASVSCTDDEQFLFRSFDSAEYRSLYVILNSGDIKTLKQTVYDNITRPAMTRMLVDRNAIVTTGAATLTAINVDVEQGLPEHFFDRYTNLFNIGSIPEDGKMLRVAYDPSVGSILCVKSDSGSWYSWRPLKGEHTSKQEFFPDWNRVMSAESGCDKKYILPEYKILESLYKRKDYELNNGVKRGERTTIRFVFSVEKDDKKVPVIVQSKYILDAVKQGMSVVLGDEEHRAIFLTNGLARRAIAPMRNYDTQGLINLEEV